LPAEAQVFNRDLFTEVRKQNPDIILLAYVPTKSYALVWNDSLHDSLKADLKDEWRLRDREGNMFSVWPNTYALHVGSGWADYLPRYVNDRILSTGLWDGVFYDESSATISWLNGGDVATTDQAWKAGMIDIFKTTRQLSPGSIIVMNGDSDAALQP